MVTEWFVEHFSTLLVIVIILLIILFYWQEQRSWKVVYEAAGNDAVGQAGTGNNLSP